MSTPSGDEGLKHDGGKELQPSIAANGADSSSEKPVSFSNEVYDSSRVDPVLAEKMVLVNTAIDEIGMTPFQWKLFFFNGFGYAVDSVSLPQASLRWIISH